MPSEASPEKGLNYFMDIVVLAGGISTERDVSITSGSMVAKALRKRGHRVVLLDVFMGYENDECDVERLFEQGYDFTKDVKALQERHDSDALDIYLRYLECIDM